MRRCPHRGFCQASCLANSRISAGIGGRPVVFGRVGPLVLDQAPVPGQQGAGRHEPVQPQVPGQQPRQGGDHGPVGPVRLRTGDLTAQDRDLMPQYQDLHVFGVVAAGEQREPAEQPGHQQVEEAGKSAIAEDRSPVQVVSRVLAPHRAPAPCSSRRVRPALTRASPPPLQPSTISSGRQFPVFWFPDWGGDVIGPDEAHVAENAARGLEDRLAF
jgi:hypothetical protein